MGCPPGAGCLYSSQQRRRSRPCWTTQTPLTSVRCVSMMAEAGLTSSLASLLCSIHQPEGLTAAGHLTPWLSWLQIGFLYLRYVGNPKTLWQWLQPYVKDSEVWNVVSWRGDIANECFGKPCLQAL